MPAYRVGCVAARQRGAIGIFYPISEIINAETPVQAEQAYRAKYETCTPVQLIDVTRVEEVRNDGR